MHLEYEFGLDPAQLLLPLCTPLQVEDLHEAVLPRKPDDDHTCDDFDWPDEAVENLHIHLLDDVLDKLKNPNVSKHVKREMLQWVNYRYIPSRELEKHAFSFQICCRFAGFDAETLREGINDRFRNTDVLL